MESSAEEQEGSWISSFCGVRGHEFFCQVDRNYIEDGFNLYGLKGVVENFGECLDVILDRAEVAEESDAASAPVATGESSSGAPGLGAHAIELYGLIHARYIVTAHGLEAMHAKYARREFGCCPRFYCDNSPVLPLGLNDAVGVEKCMVYCPRCRQVFRTNVPDNVDGAYFGTTFAHLFLMTFGFPRGAQDQPYVPRVFGFRLHRTAVERATATPAQPPTLPTFAPPHVRPPLPYYHRAPLASAPARYRWHQPPAALAAPPPGLEQPPPVALPDDFDDDDAAAADDAERRKRPRLSEPGAAAAAAEQLHSAPASPFFHRRP
ncbi:hypothetical protein CTAYLR_009462 [Chrysophaeum taylorii]|uniref:Casein kinase II subunit beta n=1 Tax=Chrysophaeum taylorii TaxID=2483200 RepID=A0AAD7U625_9STRA|nr:hypothetical protein CTAYLR_009462 [Chrysophaeum taylorii]